MTYRNDQLLQRFRMGESGHENHTGTMKIIEVDDVTLLIGFENCIYAHRSNEGVVTKYNGWSEDDTSTTTIRHIESINADQEKSLKPQIISWEEGLIKPDGATEIMKLQ